MHDLTKKYTVSIPAVPSSLKTYTSTIQIAVIPIAAIGKNTIQWNESQVATTQETEKEFETDLYNCVAGKDSMVAKTKKKPHYCLRVGYGEGTMGHAIELYYCAFVKKGKLIIVELPTSWVQCLNYGDDAAIQNCQNAEKKARQKILQYFDSVARSIKIVKR